MLAKRIVSPYASHMPVQPANNSQLGPWQVAVVRVEETPRKMLRKRKPPVLQRIRRRPIDLPEVAGTDGPILLAAPPPPPQSWCDEV